MEEKKNKIIALVIIGTVLILFATAEIYLYMKFGSQAVEKKVSTLFAIVGLYGISIAMFTKVKAAVGFKHLAKDLTSANPGRYVRSNAIFISSIYSIINLLYPKKLKEGYSITLYLIGATIVLLLSPFLFAFGLFYFLVVTPITYPINIVVNSIFTLVDYNTEEVLLKMGRYNFPLSSVLKEDPVATKGFIMGIPSLIISFLL